MTLQQLDNLKHRTCDQWGHCKPTPVEEREHRTMVELAVWFMLGVAALWMLTQWGLVKP